MRRLIILAGIALILGGISAADEQRTRPAIDKENRYQLIRLMNAEFAWVKLSLPHSQEGIKIHPDGKIDPHGKDFQLDLARYGPIARPGERVQITNVEIRDKSIYLELNGGAVKKSKWYQRLQVGGMGGTAPVAEGPDNSRAMGTSITVEFKHHVPEMTAAELKQILSPLLDFSVKSAAQAYTESLPKNVQEAIKEHRILVGMDKEMVTYSVGRPPQRIREKDPQGNEYEEWIYGKPPADVQFVRFEGEQVAQLKIMKVGGEKIVKTEPEVKIEQPKLAKVEDEKPLPRPANAPTLRRPGEKPGPQSDGTDTIDRQITLPNGTPSAPPSKTPAPPPPGGLPN
jgi:hypothetical protein